MACSAKSSRASPASCRTASTRPTGPRTGSTCSASSPEKLKCDRAQFVKALVAEGVPASAGYIPVPLYGNPVFQKHGFFAGRWPVKEMGLTTMDYSKVSLPETKRILTTSIRMVFNEGMTESLRRQRRRRHSQSGGALRRHEQMNTRFITPPVPETHGGHDRRLRLCATRAPPTTKHSPRRRIESSTPTSTSATGRTRACPATNCNELARNAARATKSHKPGPAASTGCSTKTSPA